MNLVVFWKNEIAKVVPSVAAEFERWKAQLNAWGSAEHNEDGTHIVPEWVNYQPELLNPFHTLGNGTLRGRYLKQGRIVFYQVFFSHGSTTVLNSSPIEISLPTPSVSATTLSWLVDASAFLGTAKGFVNGDNYTGIAMAGAGVVSAMSDAGEWNSAIPAMWATAGGTLVLSGWYECDPNAAPSVRFNG